jgi:outer membrane immunogenic protein
VVRYIKQLCRLLAGQEALMKGILAGSVLLLTIIGQVPAHAQNPGLVAPVTAGAATATGFIWAGPYIGAYAGYGIGTATATGTAGAFDEGVNGLTLGLNPRGAFGGITVGLNQQAGNFVWGVEADAGYLNLRDAANPPPGFDDDAGTVAYGFYATLAARFGIAMDRTLLFARAGGLIAQYLGTYGDTDGVGGPFDLTDQTTLGGPQFGYVLGAGAEFAFDANWTAKLEYNFLNLGTDTTTNSDGDTYTHRNQTHLIRFGLNFLFGN